MAPVSDTRSSEFRNHLNSLVYNQRHFTARGLRQLNKTSGVEQFTLAVILTLITAFFLITADNAGFVANSVLTLTPLILTYFYPDEKPSNDKLLIYWGAFGLATLLDPSYNDVKGYYLVKVLLLAALFLKPINGAEWILKHLQPAATTDSDRYEPSSEKGTTPGQSANSKSYGSQASTRENSKPERLKTAEQLEEPQYQIAACTSSSYTISDDVNPHDLSFEPSNDLVFNAPFGIGDGPYQLKVTNTCSRTIAFAVKSNAIKRLQVNPASALVQPKTHIYVTVCLKQFDYDPQTVAKDRLKFEYVYCPPNTNKFSFKLLQQNDLRRQKNIHIRYNP